VKFVWIEQILEFIIIDDSMRIVDLASRDYTKWWRDIECDDKDPFKMEYNISSQDIYSFGIVFWELCTEIHPLGQEYH